MRTIRNNIQLIGRLGKDPELKNLENGNKLLKVTIATNDYYKNAKGDKVTDTQWHNVIAWGKLAENMEQILKNGYEVALNGKLTHRTYEDENGIKKYFSEVVANEFVKLSQKELTADTFS